MKKKLFLLLILIAGFVKGTPCHAQTEVDNDSLRHEFITLIANDPVINSLYIAVPRPSSSKVGDYKALLIDLLRAELGLN